jgi:hypothetical protein
MQPGTIRLWRIPGIGISTGGVNMNDRQAGMLPERYAKRAILHHNIKSVEKNIYKIDD